jgi:hypothetical protein
MVEERMETEEARGAGGGYRWLYGKCMRISLFVLVVVGIKNGREDEMDVKEAP